MVSQNLTFSMRSSLLSLQSIAQSTSAVQKVLASGKKVSSVIDNPSSYYTAASLTNRATDLNLLLDSMGEAISALKNASQALDTSINFLELAKSSALRSLYENPEYSPDDPLPPDPSKTTVTKEVMNKIMRDAGISGVAVATAQELKDALASARAGDKIVIIGKIDMGGSQVEVHNGVNISGALTVIKDLGIEDQYEVREESKLTFDFTKPETSAYTYGLKMGNNTGISGITLDYATAYNNNLILASGNGIKFDNMNVNLDSKTKSAIAGAIIEVKGDISLSGNSKINMTGETFTWNYVNSTYIGTTYIDRDAVVDFDGGGLGSLLRGGNSVVNGTINAKNANAAIVYANGASGATINGTINMFNFTGKEIFYNCKLNLGSDAVINASLNTTAPSLNNETTNFQSGAEVNIYQNGIISSWKATGNGSYTGRISINGSNDLDVVSSDWKKTTRPGSADDIFDSLALADGDVPVGPDLRGSSQQFNKILRQYDKIINDGFYLGKNLLKNQGIRVLFNENSTTFLNISGVDASLGGLKLSLVNWDNTEDIQKTITALDRAISTLRNYSREFGNYYNTVNIREEFTSAMVDILQEGADKLTLADMNQASADILSLQTRQQLAINSLSLASQASQNVLKLFM